MKNLVTAERLRELLHYDPSTGLFTRRVSLSNDGKPGDPAGSVPNKVTGYVAVSVDGRLYYAHRLAWLYVHGVWPQNIDHRNGNRADNKLDNLRECSKSENAQNQKRKTNNRSGFVGVHFDSVTGRWRASIRISGKTTKLGRFDTREEAAAAYAEAKLTLHPFQPTLRETANG